MADSFSRQQIIEALFTGKNFNDCISKIKPYHLQDDLRQEVISRICELPPDKLIYLHKRRELEFYTIRIILNEVRNNRSEFSKKFKNHNLEYTEAYGGYYHATIAELIAISGHTEKNSTEENHTERLKKECLEDQILLDIQTLSATNPHWYGNELLKLYLEVGNYRAIEKITRIPYSTAYKSIQKYIASIRNNKNLSNGKIKE